MKSANKKGNRKHRSAFNSEISGCLFFFSYSTEFWRLRLEIQWTLQTDTNPWCRGTPHWGPSSRGVDQIPLHILKTYIFIEEALLLQYSWGLPRQDSFPEMWIYIQRVICLKSKLMSSFSLLEAACRGKRSSFWRLSSENWKHCSREDECC